MDKFAGNRRLDQDRRPSGQVTDIQWRFTALLTRNGEKVVAQPVDEGPLLRAVRQAPASPRAGGAASASMSISRFPGQVINLVESDIAEASIANLGPATGAQLRADGFWPGLRPLRLALLADQSAARRSPTRMSAHILATLQRNGIRLATDDHNHPSGRSRAPKHRAEVEGREMQPPPARHQRRRTVRPPGRQPGYLAQRLTRRPSPVATSSPPGCHRPLALHHGQRRGRSLWQPPEGPRRLLEKRGPGSVFGEIGLMTGAPRRATVIASTDVETYRLDKGRFPGHHRAAAGTGRQAVRHPGTPTAALCRTGTAGYSAGQNELGAASRGGVPPSAQRFAILWPGTMRVHLESKTARHRRRRKWAINGKIFASPAVKNHCGFSALACP